MALRRKLITPGLQLSLRAAVAAGLAVAAAELLRLEYPLYAMIGAVIVTELSAGDTRRLGSSRLVGTFIGASVGAALSQIIYVRPVTIAVGIAVTMVLTQAVGLPKAARLAGYVCGIVLLSYHDHPWAYAWYRMVETVIGIAAAILVSLVPKLIQPDSQGQTSGLAKVAPLETSHPPRAMVMATRTTPMAATATPVRHGRHEAYTREH